jgi:hypothetical protein
MRLSRPFEDDVARWQRDPTLQDTGVLKCDPSPQEPVTEKACPFLLAVSLWAAHHLYAEVKVFEYQDPTASRYVEVHELAVVDTRRNASRNHPLQLNRFVWLLAFVHPPGLFTNQGDPRF